MVVKLHESRPEIYELFEGQNCVTWNECGLKAKEGLGSTCL
jgi:hypothetical protein